MQFGSGKRTRTPPIRGTALWPWSCDRFSKQLLILRFRSKFNRGECGKFNFPPRMGKCSSTRHNVTIVGSNAIMRALLHRNLNPYGTYRRPLRRRKFPFHSATRQIFNFEKFAEVNMEAPPPAPGARSSRKTVPNPTSRRRILLCAIELTWIALWRSIRHRNNPCTRAKARETERNQPRPAFSVMVNIRMTILLW